MIENNISTTVIINQVNLFEKMVSVNKLQDNHWRKHYYCFKVYSLEFINNLCNVFIFKNFGKIKRDGNKKEKSTSMEQSADTYVIGDSDTEHFHILCFYEARFLISL